MLSAKSACKQRLLFYVDKRWLADMAKGIDHSDVVLVIEVMAVIFGDRVWEVMWVEPKCCMTFVCGLDGRNLCVPSKNFIFPRIRDQAFRPLSL